MKTKQNQLFDFLIENQKIYPFFATKIEQSVRLMLRYLIIQKLIYKILFRNLTHKKYLFFGLKYKELIESLSKNDVLLLGGGKSYLKYSLKTKIPTLFVYNYFKFLLPFFKNISSDFYPLSQSIKHLTKRLIQTDACYLIVESDSLPPHRMIIQAAKQAHIKTICILHGISTSTCPATLSDGQYADYIFVYDDHQKNVLIRAGIESSRIRVFGFYYPIPLHPPLNLDRKKVCVFGQPWKEYNINMFEHYQTSTRWIILTLLQNRFDVIYKPHPAEQEISYIQDISNEVMINYFDMESCLAEYDLFVSYASTALLEATLHGKLAVQIYTGNLYDDNFENSEYAYTVNLYDTDSFISHLEHSKPIVPLHLIELSKKPLQQRFEEIISTLE
ncbi:MAG: hypothetical protein PHI47_07260 [Sulfuricurvum sp.]|uniref:polysialyltransferase family glycosyltransferase n=1 Tax=Sulfuricurvum sp. TaxID=2025608 RepID=UPI002602EFAE|nr:hypothetical protein [Sulfuricurvum sp.]MDD5159832.1 hypothetical protein [Sulfuricurvum sp.]